MSYDVGIRPNAPDPIYGSEPKVIPAWNEIESQFSQGPSFLPSSLRVTMFFGGNMITTTLEQCARELQVATMDAFDQYFSQPLLSFIWSLIPTRTGKLADLIMQSILLYRSSNSRTFIFNIPQGYPPTITNPKHNGEIGYGPKYTPTYTSPLIQKVRDTPKGAYYLLSDPIAEPNYLVTIQNYIFSSTYQLLSYLNATKWYGYVHFRVDQIYVHLFGQTTTKNQHAMIFIDINGKTIKENDIGISLDSLAKSKDLWEDNHWASQIGQGEQSSIIGDLSLFTKRNTRYLWNFGLTLPVNKFTFQ